jgi:hypothetical protein
MVNIVDKRSKDAANCVRESDTVGVVVERRRKIMHATESSAFATWSGATMLSSLTTDIVT